MKRKFPVVLVFLSAILFTMNLIYHANKTDIEAVQIDSDIEQYIQYQNVDAKADVKNQSSTIIKPTRLKKNIAVSNELDDTFQETPVKNTIVDLEVIESFSNAIVNGEQRAPPIVRQEAEESPSQEVLDDPDNYLSFQANQRKKILVSYVNAAKPKIKKLKRLVAEGEARGISDKKLQEGKMKIQKLEEMVEQLKQENPDLIDMLDDT